MLISFLKFVNCLIHFPCVILLSIFFYWFYYIFHVYLFLIPNYYVSFFSFMVILLLFLLPFINHLSLAFFISSIANLHSSLYHIFFLSFCVFILSYKLLFGYLDYCFNTFPFFININVNNIFSVQISSIWNLLLISIAYSCFHFGFWRIFTIFLFSLYLLPVFTLNFTLKFIFSKLWSYPMSGPLSVLMPVIALLNLLPIKTWSIWFAVLPPAKYHVS